MREQIVPKENGTMAEQLAALQGKLGNGEQSNSHQSSKKKTKGQKVSPKQSAEPQQKVASSDSLAALQARFS